MKKKNALSILLLVILVIIGFFAGIMIAKYDLIPNITLMDLIVYYLIFIISLFIVINLHELGHYLFGKLLGYRLIMYRVGPLSFTYVNDKMQFEWIKNKGYGGLCAMIPPSNADFNNRKHLLYYAGGVLVNFLTGLMILFALPYVSSHYLIGSIYIFSFSSLFLGVVNLIPFKTSGINTDGKIIFELLKKDDKASSIIATLNLSMQLTSGIRPGELHIDPELFTDTKDPTLLIFHYYQALDQGDDQQARHFAQQMIDHLDHFSAIVLPGIYNELITAGVQFNISEWVDQYYALNETSLNKDYDLNGERVKAYYAWYVGNSDQAKEHIEKAKAVANKFPIPGQVKMELMLLNNLEQKLTQ